MYYQSGIPYTPVLLKFDGEPYEDHLNKYAKRSPAYTQVDLALSRKFILKDMSISLGVNVFNLLDTRNILDIYPETGTANTRGEYYTKEIGLPENGGTVSNSFYDRPWMYGTAREINFFIQINYR